MSPMTMPLDPESSPSRARLRVLTWKGSDPELLEQVVSGRPGSAERLFQRFAPDINRVVWKLMGADADHDDIVHDVFMKVWSLMSAGRVNKPDSLASWVVAVAIHTVRKELRKRYIRARLLGNERPHQPLSETLPVEARDLLEKIYGILSKIPPDERIAFTLRYMDQRPLAEIADLLECSLATTKRRLKRAEERFALHAQRFPALVEQLSGRSWGEGAP